MGDVQAHFAAACHEILGAAFQALTNPHGWRTYLNTGAAEHAIAGDHHGRHWLELLQNARDAAYQLRAQSPANTCAGRVLVGVTESGVLVANTGVPFALHDVRVRHAVQYLQRSTKQGGGFIGHKGIGLKSVLLRAGAFVVRTRVDGEELRASFSRRCTAVAVLGALAAAPSIPHEDRAALGGLLEGEPAYSGAELHLDAALDHWAAVAEIPRLPLFLQPHPDPEASEAAEGGLLLDLLSDAAPFRNDPEGVDPSGDPTDLPGYSTVVYLPFEDRGWDELLDRVRSVLPDQHVSAFDRARGARHRTNSAESAKQAWEELNALDPRVFVLLGEMSEVQIVRFETGRLVSAIRYDIAPPLLSGGADDAEVEVQAVRWDAESGARRLPGRRLLAFGAPHKSSSEDTDELSPTGQIRVVFDAPGPDDPWRPPKRSYPLSLYYPIDNAPTGLPFVVHGPFHVNSSRTGLAEGDTHNRKVLEAALEVAKRAFDRLAGDPHVRSAMPWLVAPCGTAPDAELLSWFHGSVGALAAELAVVPTANGGQRRGAEVLFDPRHPIAFEALRRHSKGTPLLAPESLATYERWRGADDKSEAPSADAAYRAAAAAGLGRLLNDADALAEALAAAWREADGGEDRLHVDLPETEGRSWFSAVIRLLAALEDGPRRALAQKLGAANVPLVPVEAEMDPGLVRLVRVEDRTGAVTKRRAPRVLFWRDAESARRRVDVPAPPPGIPVYLADTEQHTGAAEQLGGLWREWGTAQYDGLPNLFREVAQRVLEAGSYEPEAARYLANLLHRIHHESPGEAADLTPAPFSGWRLEALNEIHKYWRQTRQRRDQFRRLRSLGSIRLPVRGGGDAPASSLVLGEAWATVLDAKVGQESEEDVDGPRNDARWATALRAAARWRAARGLHLPRVADPEDRAWTTGHVLEVGDQRKILDLLFLLGVQLGVPVALRWVDWIQDRSQRDDPLSGRVSLERARRWSREGRSDAGGPPQGQLESYRRCVLDSAHHPAFTAGHSPGCATEAQTKRQNTAVLAAWAWAPELEDGTEGWSAEAIAAFREWLVAAWPDLQSDVVWSGWVCEQSSHNPYGWKTKVPSLLLHQLTELLIWEPRGDWGGLTAASEMIRWPDGEGEATGRPLHTWLPGFPMDAAEAPSGLLDALGVRPLDELAPGQALARMSALLERYGKPKEPNSDSDDEMALAPPMQQSSWQGALNRLTERLVAPLGPERKPEDLWRRHDLGLRGGWLRASRQRDSVAIRVQAGPDGLARIAAPTTVFPKSEPHWRDIAALDDGLLVEAPRRVRRAFAELALAMGAVEGRHLDPPVFTGDQAASEDVLERLCAAARPRLDIVLAVLQLRRRENLDEAAETFGALLADLLGIEAEGPDGAWSGLTADSPPRLAFSLPAWRSESADGSAGVQVLAEGLAAGLRVPAAATELEYALSADRQRVEGGLRRRGVDLDALRESVAALEAARARVVELRVQRVIELLDVAAAGGATATLGAVALTSLQSEARNAATPDALHRLLRLLVQEVRAAFGEDGVDRLLESPLLSHLVPLGPAQAQCTEAKRGLGQLALSLAITRLVDALEEEPMESRSLGRLVTTASESVARLRAVDRALTLQRLAEEAGVQCGTESGRLLEWLPATWSALANAATARSRALLGTAPPWLRQFDVASGTAGLAALVRGGFDESSAEGRAAVTEVERRLDDGVLAFPEEAFAMAATGSSAPNASAIPVGGSGTGAGGSAVAPRHLARARVAELFVLEDCWRRFLALDRPAREGVLDLVLERRKEGHSGLAWGVQRMVDPLAEAVDEAREQLLADTPGNRARRVFRRLLDVTAERGPGFDVIDPFGARPTKQPSEHPEPLRVEVKALTQGSPHRVFITTNEYHKARLDGSSYVLRLIVVPDDPSNVAEVRWFADVRDPVQTLDLERQMVTSVRGGHVPLILT